jgi:hypothetical protein
MVGKKTKPCADEGYVWNRVFLKFNVFLFQIHIFIFSDRFNVLILKIIFKNKKYYFNVFSSEKHFELQLLLHFQTPSKWQIKYAVSFILKYVLRVFFNWKINKLVFLLFSNIKY